MFGYVIVNKQELKYKEFDLYQSYYCGLCRELKERFGVRGQLTLTYDMTFLVMLLTGLYETQTEEGSCKCIAHPFEKHAVRRNCFTSYTADMNILMTYYQCMDDWLDEKKIVKRGYAGLLKKECKAVETAYPNKAKAVKQELENLHAYEKAGETNLDLVSGCFGNIMSEVFACRDDEWKEVLGKVGFFLGKFIYLMDAYEDLEKDRRDGNYNPFFELAGQDGYEEVVYRILTMMMAECSRAFEKLPVIENAGILRNILYSGVWCRYELVKDKRKEQQENA